MIKTDTIPAYSRFPNLSKTTDERAATSALADNPKSNDGTYTAIKQVEQLTAREIAVLQSVARGRLNKQTASELCISIKTVEKYRDRLTNKLGIHGTAGLTHFAIFTGIIECNPQTTMA